VKINGKFVSGQHYVQLLFVEEDGSESIAPTRVVAVRNCRHQTTICTECMESWSWDYEILPRTAAGRDLLERLKSQPA
jgi:hypothetical protein